MIDDMEKLSKHIREHVEHYEERMATAMMEGNEGTVKRVHREFQEVVGKEVADFAEMAGDPVKSTLLLLLSLPSEDDPDPSF
ncbi:MAG TPA: hypothetical protein VMU60_01130 [Syntrophobacteria bacterium]|nr:hypothetical protein [Syntrophobacteria bacterium]